MHCSKQLDIMGKTHTGASIPPNTLEQVPPSLLFTLPFPPLPSPPIRSSPPLIAAIGGLGERFSSPSGSGRSPAAKRYLVNFRLKISPLVATTFRSFSGNETSNYAEKLIIAFLQKLRGSALKINALPPLIFCKNASPYFFHGAFAPSFIWSRRPWTHMMTDGLAPRVLSGRSTSLVLKRVNCDNCGKAGYDNISSIRLAGVVPVTSHSMTPRARWPVFF